MTSTILGAIELEQLNDNIASLDIRLTTEHLRTRDEGSALEPAFSCEIFTAGVNRMTFGGTDVQDRQ